MSSTASIANTLKSSPSQPPPGPCRVLACSGSLEGGGSERQLWQLVTHLDRSRFSPEVYLLARRGIYLDQLPADMPLHSFDSQHPTPPSFPPGRISRMQARHLRRTIQQRMIDVVYDRTFHMSLLTGAALPASMPRVSVIVSPPSRDLPQTEHRFVFLKRWLLRRSYRRAAATLCVSHEVADDAANYYRLERTSLLVLPNPVDVAAVEAKAREALPETARILRERSAHQLHVVLVGRMTPEKGHALAIETWQRLRDINAHAQATASTSSDQRAVAFHLHLVGNGPLESALGEQIHKLDLQSSIHLHGYQTNPYPIIANCDLVFVPSRYEGFPNAALEALALKKPLLMTDYGTTARTICGAGNERGHIVGLNQSNVAAELIRDRYFVPGPWLQRAEAGHQWVLEQHAFAPWLEVMMQMFERARAGHSIDASWLQTARDQVTAGAREQRGGAKAT